MGEWTRAKAVEEFGEEAVDLAESFYETDFDKHFGDLEEAEQREYLCRARAFRNQTQRV